MPASRGAVRRTALRPAGGPRARRGGGHPVSRHRRDRPRDPAGSVGAARDSRLTSVGMSELALLEAHVGGPWRPEPVITVVGDAGAGKSRLLRAAGAPRAATDVRLLQARCRAYGDVEPFFPFVEILREALGAACRGDRRLGRDRRRASARLTIRSSHSSPCICICCRCRASRIRSRATCRASTFRRRCSTRCRRSPPAWRAATQSSCCSRTGTGRTAHLAPHSRMREIVAAQGLLFVVTTRPERGAWTSGPPTVRAFNSIRSISATSAAIMRAVLRVHGCRTSLPDGYSSAPAVTRSSSSRCVRRCSSRGSSRRRRRSGRRRRRRGAVAAGHGAGGDPHAPRQAGAERARGAPRCVGDRPRVRTCARRRGARPRGGSRLRLLPG